MRRYHATITSHKVSLLYVLFLRQWQSLFRKRALWNKTLMIGKGAVFCFAHSGINCRAGFVCRQTVPHPPHLLYVFTTNCKKNLKFSQMRPLIGLKANYSRFDWCLIKDLRLYRIEWKGDLPWHLASTPTLPL